MLNLTQNDIFAIYRLPNTSDTYMILQENQDTEPYDKKTANDSGFVFYPFSTDSHKSLFIKADKILKNEKFDFKPQNIDNSIDISKEEYLNKITKFKEQTKSGFNKIVLSRTKSIKNNNLNIFNTYKNLDNEYPNAMIFFVNHPYSGTWIGATPEVLLKKQEGLIKTMALAGTQLIESHEKAIWADKEIKEQKAVMDFIEYILKKHKSSYSSKGPYTKKVAEFKNGILVHLATEYSAETNSNIFDLILDLHPTPAVSGLPKADSIKFILENEGYNRKYYTGFLGPQNIEKKEEIDFFVNLRTMQIFKNKFLLYVGGGINSQSIPEDEWIETENKANTLRQIIDKQ